MSLDELRQLARRHHKRATLDLDIAAVTRNSNDLPNNKVRVWRDDIRQEMIVNGFIRDEGVDVWLREMRDKEYQIVDVNIPAGTQRFGAALGAKAQPQGMDEVTKRSIPGIGFKPGRVEVAAAGGLNIHVPAFAHIGGYWAGGDLDVGSHEPGTAGYVVWVLVYLDPVANTLAATAAAPVFGEPQDLSDADIAAITSPPGAYPLGALTLKNGQTETVESRFADWRYHVATVGAPQSTASFSNPPTAAELDAEFGAVADGFAADIDDGGSGTTFWHVRRVNGAWVYASMTLAT